MKENLKLVPELRFPKFEGEWSENIFDNICTIQTGSKDTQNRIENGKYPFYVRSNTIERINSFSFDEQAILTSGDGAGVGKIYHLVDGKFDVHQRVYVLNKFNPSYSIHFTYYYFSNKFYKRVMRLSAKNSVDSVRRDMISKMKIIHPELIEQQKIANFLTAIDNRIQTLEKKKTLLEQYKKGMMQKIFSQEIRFRDDDGKAFGDWEVRKLGDVFSIFNGYAFSSTSSVGIGIVWVKIADVGIQRMKKDSLSFLPEIFGEKHSKFILKKGDYVIALTRPVLNGELKIAKIDAFFDNSLLNQRVGKIVSENNTTFIYYVLQQEWLINVIENNIAGTDPPNLSPKEISHIKLSVPKLSEQTKIANFLTAIDKKIELVNKQIEHSKTYKKGLLQKMFV